MNASVLQELNAIFSEIFSRTDLTLNQEMKTGDIQDWDSYKNVEILIACEAHWNIRFSSREIDAIRTVGQLMGCIASKVGIVG